jgi:UDP-glucose 4-epimerase
MKEQNSSEFLREKELLEKVMLDNSDKTIIYFSTCSIESLETEKTDYVQHKLEMENIVQRHKSFYIFRLPQVVGITKSNTIIKYFVESIIHNRELIINKYSTRNLISISDVFQLCSYIIDHKIYLNEITNIASQNNISIVKIVETIEYFINKKAKIDIIDFGVPFTIDISKIEKLKLNTRIFNKDYYFVVIKEYCKQVLLKKILVTGSSGFVGSYFINKYKDKYEIKTFSFLKDDVSTLDCNNLDVVFHLSALVHQMGGASKEEYERVNVIQTLQFAKKAKESGVRHFVFMSTVKVYGEETDSIYTESTSCHPEDEYGKSKLKAEFELQKLEDENFKVSIVRTPIVYGYGVKANIKNLVNLVNKVPVLPFGSIENKRSMVYIGNLCHFVNEIITQQKSGVFLACDDGSLSTSKLIELIAKNLDKKIYLLKIPFFETLLKIVKPSFYQRLYSNLEVDNTITKEKLNLKNPYTVEEGIRLMIQGERK